MLQHAKCGHCGLYFIDEDSLSSHDQAFHAMKDCDLCGKKILESQLKKHLNSHKIEQGYQNVVSQGKIRASKKKNSEKSSTPTAYQLFMKESRPLIKTQNPTAKPQEIIKMLNEAWNKEKAEGNKDFWEEKAKNVRSNISQVAAGVATNEDEPEMNYAISKCSVCGTMIANIKRHMELAHPTSQDVGLSSEVSEAEVIPLPNDGNIVPIESEASEIVEVSCNMGKVNGIGF